MFNQYFHTYYLSWLLKNMKTPILQMKSEAERG